MLIHPQTKKVADDNLCFHLFIYFKGYSFTADDLKDDNKAITTYHRIIEAFKFGYAQKTKSGDPEFMDREKVEKVSIFFQWSNN